VTIQFFTGATAVPSIVGVKHRITNGDIKVPGVLGGGTSNDAGIVVGIQSVAFAVGLALDTAAVAVIVGEIPAIVFFKVRAARSELIVPLRQFVLPSSCDSA